jgi:DNA-binding MltR family transcriptional regulator
MADEKKDPWADAPPEILRLATFLNGFYKESDRGAVLMASSLLDEVLLSMLGAFLTDTHESRKLLEGFNAPLGTFHSRILAAYSMGLIEDRELREVDAIRKIRNHFGHSWNETNFDAPEIEAHLKCFRFESSNPRQRLNETVANLLGEWLWRAHYVAKERRIVKTWPNKAGFWKEHTE